MKKKAYIQPSLCLFACQAERPVAASNQITDNGISFNRSTMEEADGSDAAAKSSTYSVWDNSWE